LKNVIVVDRWKAGLGKIQLFSLSREVLEPTLPIICVGDVKFRKDFEEKTNKGKKIKSMAIVTSTKETLEIEKLENALSCCFGVSVLSLEEAVGDKYDAVMQIVSGPSNRESIMFRLVSELVEVGPCIGISHLLWEL